MAPKPLSDYPRPPDDNGRGVHWSTRIYHPSGDDLQYWIDQLLALQIKWVKLLDDGGTSSLELCQALLAHDIMPVVRIFRAPPNPGHLRGREMEAVQTLIDAGVRYFETNNEPDLPAEWDGPMPPNWLDIVVDNFLIDADFILGAGGLPALPAMGPGSRSNAMAKVVERGRIDVFERGAWVAIHNYTLNHPLDYPDNAVNQEGEPITQEEFDRLAEWQYSHLTYEEIQEQGIDISEDDYNKFQRWAWDGRNIDMVNELREQAKNPGDTILDDANCFRGFEFFGNIMEETLGFHVPIISTEGGPVVGWGDDKRYAKLNPTTHGEWQLEICRFMQDEAPLWYFSCCTWLLASRPLGDFNPTWDQMSWYTHVWDLQFGLDGELPIVQLLKDTPSKVRHELREPEGPPAKVDGTVTGRDGAPLENISLALCEGDRVVATTLSLADGRYELSVPAGQYDLHVEWVGPVVRAITLTPGDTDSFDLAGIDPAGDYTITGTIRDTGGTPLPNIVVALRRNGLTHATAISDADGAFTLSPGLAGEYTLAVTDGGTTAVVSPEQPNAIADIVVAESGEQRYFLTEKRLLPPDETGNNRMFYGRVVDEQGRGIKDIELEMRWVNAPPGTNFPCTVTGKDPFKPDPDGYYEFLHSPGEFMIEVVQGDYESDVATGLVTTGIPGRETDPITYEVNFQLRAAGTEAPSNSVVFGNVPGGRTGQLVRLWSGNESTDFELNTSRQFRFEGLAAGVYDLELAGIGTIMSDFVLDGSNQVEVDFPLLGAIVGKVLDAPVTQRSVTLISESHGFTRQGELTQDSHYRFTNLPAGTYRVELDDAILAGLISDGISVVQAPDLQVGLERPRGNSVLSGYVRSADDQTLPGIAVALLHQNQLLSIEFTDTYGRYEFNDLGSGVYSLLINGEIVASDLQIDGQSALVADLHYAPATTPPIGRIAHYYLLATADPALLPELIRLVGPWLEKQTEGVVGFSANEAEHAAVVTVLGDGASDGVMAALQSAGCQVIDRRQDLVALAEMLRAE